MRGYWVAPLERTQEYREVPPELVAYARTNLVWEQVQSDLNVEPQGSLYPNFYNVVDLLAAGKQPLLPGATPCSTAASTRWRRSASAPGPGRACTGTSTRRAAGEEEDELHLEAEPGDRAPATRRRRVRPRAFSRVGPGPSRAPWMRDCFGPFDAAGMEFGDPPRRRLLVPGRRRRRSSCGRRPRRSPRSMPSSPWSRWAGRARPAQRGPGDRLPDGGRRARLGARPAAGRDGGARLTASVDGAPVGSPVTLDAEAAGEALAISFETAEPGDAGLLAAGRGVVARLPSVAGGDLSIKAARDSGARVELGGLDAGRLTVQPRSSRASAPWSGRRWADGPSASPRRT